MPRIFDNIALELLPALIDAGLDVVQMDQQENMGLDALDRVLERKNPRRRARKTRR